MKAAERNMVSAFFFLILVSNKLLFNLFVDLEFIEFAEECNIFHTFGCPKNLL